MEKTYRKGVGIVLFNRDKKVLVGKRIDEDSDAWQFPQGGIDEGESPTTTAYRELLEEIGTNNAQIVRELDRKLSYDLPLELQQKLWYGQYAGQVQNWFLMAFMGEENEINIITPHPEFIDYKWIDIAQAPQLIVDFKQNLYRKLVQEFSAIIEGYEYDSNDA